ncbi:hypothetical protein RYX36_034394 [Vicia faba]
MESEVSRDQREENIHVLFHASGGSSSLSALVSAQLHNLHLDYISDPTSTVQLLQFYNQNEFLPTCVPSLPTLVLPPSYTYQSVILHLTSIFSATKHFIFSEDVSPKTVSTNVDQL